MCLFNLLSINFDFAAVLGHTVIMERDAHFLLIDQNTTDVKQIR